MSDGSHWPGTWPSADTDHSRGDHADIIKAMLAPPNSEPVMGCEADEENLINIVDVDIRLPMLVYVSREKRPGYDHNKKTGAMNVLVRTSAIMSNGPFILNLDCDHCIYNSLSLREGMDFILDRGGDRICYIQFPQRFEGVDPSNRYANHNTVFFDVSMRTLDGLQGPIYTNWLHFSKNRSIWFQSSKGYRTPWMAWYKENYNVSQKFQKGEGKLKCFPFKLMIRPEGGFPLQFIHSNSLCLLHHT